MVQQIGVYLEWYTQRKSSLAAANAHRSDPLRQGAVRYTAAAATKPSAPSGVPVAASRIAIPAPVDCSSSSVHSFLSSISPSSSAVGV